MKIQIWKVDEKENMKHCFQNSYHSEKNMFKYLTILCNNIYPRNYTRFMIGENNFGVLSSDVTKFSIQIAK